TGAYQQFDATILVLAPLELRIQRVQKRDALRREEVLKRVANQWTDVQKMALTPFHIVNDGRPLLIQVEQLIAELRKNSRFNTPF
ncbi:MAG: dephospho-CoA kinase, partial [Crocinitomicaceae bacterium]|nr:dephospho-CoA kinase [Crocinitomicaceae bacterium]